VAPIRIGARSNVQDNAVLHVDTGSPCVVGHDVTIGHGAIVHAAVVGNGVTIGMGAIVLSRSRIGDGAIVAAGALVPEDGVVAASVLVMGVPARETRRLGLDGRQRSLDNAARYVDNNVRYRRQPWAADREGIDHGR
ncbi:MAG TPA: gamma carbonic anhydrase family protein, partial [Thermomicrobiales bacterium]|nr:gamma carbonic anhydrase family protein [Thermomicrobiales bacterium]